MEKAQLDEQFSITNKPTNKDLTSEQLDIDINIEVINSAKSPRAQSSYWNSIYDNLFEETQNK